MNRSKELAKNSLILSIGTFFPKAVNIITLPIITGHLSKVEYGTLDLVSTLVSLLLPVMTLQIHAAAFRFLIDCREDYLEKKRIISNIYGFVIPVSCVALGILYFVLYKLEPLTRLLICLFYFFDIILKSTRQVIRGLSNNKLYSASTAVESVSNAVFIILLVSVANKSLHGVLLSYILSVVLGTMLLIVRGRIIRYIDFQLLSKATLKQMLDYSWPMIPNSLSHWALSASDRLVLLLFVGMETVAIYGAANKIPQIFGQLHSTFALAWQENASVALRDEDVESYYSKVFDTVFSLLSGVMALVIGATPILFLLLIKGDYKDAYPQMPILFLGMFFSGISSFFGGIYVAHKKTKNVGMTSILAAACNIMIDLLLVTRIGIYAASVSTLISYLLLAVYRMIDVIKIQEISFNYRKILICLLVLFGMSGICWVNKTITNGLNMIIGFVFAYILNQKTVKGLVNAVLSRLKNV